MNVLRNTQQNIVGCFFVLNFTEKRNDLQIPSPYFQ